ncbi:MAG: hypothetical protein Q7J15_05230 [Candidatus Desulfaltia sp.]|nr:hypothetical protein [Candidatus Desulfaltia sp.]
MNYENSPNQGVEMAQPLEDEEIIELTDEVVDASENGMEPGEFEDTVEFYELEDKKEDKPIARPADDNLATSISADNVLDKEISGDQNMADRFADLPGMDLEPEIEVLEDAHEEVSLSHERLEETLERVVEKMFSEKIEKMLAEMIETAVSREIKSIKEKLRDL